MQHLTAATCRYTYAFAITAFRKLLEVQSAASLCQNKTGPPPPPAGFRSRRLREKLRLTTVTLGGGRGGVREGHAGFIGELFQGWKYIYEWGRLKRFHFFETEHVVVRRFYWRFISGGLKPRRDQRGRNRHLQSLYSELKSKWNSLWPYIVVNNRLRINSVKKLFFIYILNPFLVAACNYATNNQQNRRSFLTTPNILIKQRSGKKLFWILLCTPIYIL